MICVGLLWNAPAGADFNVPMLKKPSSTEEGRQPPVVPSRKAFVPVVPIGLPDLPDDGPRFTTPVEGPGAASFMEGVEAYGRRDFKTARTAFRTIVEQHAGSPLVGPARAFLAELVAADKANARNRMPAIEAYRAVLRDFPRTPNAARAQWRVGDLYAEMGLRIEAQATYEHGLNDFLTGADADRALLGLAVNFTGWNKWREAEHRFQNLKDHAGNTVVLQYATLGLADTLYTEGQSQDALAFYEEVYARWPEFFKKRPQSFLKFIDTAMALGQDHLGRRLSTTLYNMYPQMPEASLLLVRIGDSFRRAGLRDRAGMFYTEAVSRYADSLGSAIARMRLAELSFELITAEKGLVLRLMVQAQFRYGPVLNLDGEEQRATLRTVADEQAKLAIGSEALYHLGEQFEAIQDWEQTIQAYRKLIARAGRIPDDPWPAAAGRRLSVLLEPWIDNALQAHDDLGVVNLFHQAGRLAENSFSTNKPLLQVLLQVAGAHRRIGFTPEAVKLYLDLVQNGAAMHLREEALVGLGQSYMDQGDYVAARQVFERYWIQYPSGRWKAEALRWLAEAFQADDKHAGTIRICRRWLQNFPSPAHPLRPDMLLMLAQALVKDGEVAEGLRVYAEAERAGALAKPPALIRYADLLVQEKRYDEAVTRYQVALRTDLDATQAEWVRFQLARIRRTQTHYADARSVLQELANLSQDDFVDRLSVSMQTGLPKAPPATASSPKGGS